eukprot:m.14775 g.14775  ORF g.14775 m.14775 type:complete len:393 (+) comp3197_c0_seq2:285-1463(+)
MSASDTAPDSSETTTHEDAAPTADVTVGSDDNTVGETSEEVPEWTDVLGTGGLRKKTVRDGTGRNTRPKRGEEATYALLVTVDGTPTSAAPVQCTAIVGEMDHSLALDLVLPLMQVGEVCKVVTSRRYDNRPLEVESDDPTIEYDLELLSVKPAVSVEDMSLKERVDRARLKLDDANALYTRKKYEDAAGQLRRAIHYLGDGDAVREDDDALDVAVRSWANLAASLLKIPNFRETITACDEALKLQPDNEKAKYRKAMALYELKEYARARTIALPLAKAGNGAAIKLAKAIKEALAKEKEDERDLARRMVSALDGTSEDATRIHEAQQKKKAQGKETLWQKWGSMIGVAVSVLAMFIVVSVALMQSITMHVYGPEHTSGAIKAVPSPLSDEL